MGGSSNSTVSSSSARTAQTRLNYTPINVQQCKYLTFVNDNNETVATISTKLNGTELDINITKVDTSSTSVTWNAPQ